MTSYSSARAWLRRHAAPILALACLALALLGGLLSVQGAAAALPVFLALAAGLVVLAALAWHEAGRAERTRRTLQARIERLEAETAELQIFVHAASHDLHAPLRKIQSFGERLRDQLGLLADPAAVQSLDRMTTAADRMRALLDALLTHVRVRDDRTRITSVDLDALVRSVLETRSAEIRAAGARVEIGDLGRVEGDPGQLCTLVENILDNALKYRRSDANINIRIAGRDEGESRVIEISDNGIGFDPRHAERIFGLFERLHAPNVYEGSGVGLATCRKIAERHGGSLRAHGKPGEGACFTLILPCRQANLSSDSVGGG